MTFSSKIVAYRIKNNLTQTMFAEKIGVSQKDVNDWEMNDIQPNSEILIKIAKVLNIPIDDLIFNNNDNQEPIINYDFTNNHIKYAKKVSIIDYNNKERKNIDEIYLIKIPYLQNKSPQYKIVGYNHRKYLNELNYDLAYYENIAEASKEFEALRKITATYTIQYATKIKIISFGDKIQK